ncbi:MAG: universal stress protein [Spirochaetes bacterium]|nr:universal stress protein [Spirochaetota bacterium]
MKILLPVSSKEIDSIVLKWIRDVAQKLNAQVDVLNVQYSYETFTLAYPTYPEFVYMTDKPDETHDKKALENAKNIAGSICDMIKAKAGSGIKTKCLGELGEPAGVIINMAEEGKYDLVVLRDRDRTDVGRFFLGSITDKVVHHCKTAVLVLK